MEQQRSAATSSQQSPIWLLVSLILCVIGMAVSIYATIHHYEVVAQGATNAFCNINQTFNCDDVAKSQYSVLFDVPMGIWGLAYFAAAGVLLIFSIIRFRDSDEHVIAYRAMTWIGVAVSIILASLAFFKVGALCLTCIGIYVLTILLALLWWFNRQQVPGNATLKTTVAGLMNAGIAVAIIVAGYKLLIPGLGHSSRKDTAAVAPINPDLPRLASKAQEIPINRSAFSGFGEDYRIGPDSAKVVVVEFGDFQCPACKAMQPTVKQLLTTFGDKIQLVFRNYPLDQACNSSVNHKMHEFACQAAVMGRCAGQYGKFWDFHDLVYDKQKDLSEKALKEWALGLGLTAAQVDGCLATTGLMDKVRDDLSLGSNLGVDSTPSFFFNGKKFVGNPSFGEMRVEIEKLLAQ